jgi:CheY-specific phosphatase CheX
MEAAQNTHPVINESMAPDVHAAVEQTFSRMLGLTVTSSFAVYEKESVASSDVSGIMNLVHEKLEGSLIITFPQATLFAVLKNFYKRDFTEIDKVAAAAVGELLNIIFGVLKFRIQPKGMTLGRALPNIVVGAGHKVSNATWTLCMEFKCEAGDFRVLVTRIPPE